MTDSTAGTSNISTADEFGLLELIGVLRGAWKLLLMLPLLAGVLGFGIASLIPPLFTARTSFLPPVQANSASAALSALGPLGALAGVATTRTPADQYVSILRSNTVSDRIIERHQLRKIYDKETLQATRKSLAGAVVVNAGKKDGIIMIEVDDTDPQRAADIANQYVDELRLMNNKLALSEAKQRRVFFEQQLQAARDSLAKAQATLQSSGFNQSAIRSEPRAAAEGYAKLRAELTAAEVKLQAQRQTFADGAPELGQQLAVIGALRAQLTRLEQTTSPAGNEDYVTKYRDFKYQETLYELFARQYETARIDEAREGGLIQVIDPAMPPERKSKPQRALIAGAAWLLALLIVAAWLVVKRSSTLRTAATLAA